MLDYQPQYCGAEIKLVTILNAYHVKVELHDIPHVPVCTHGKWSRVYMSWSCMVYRIVQKFDGGKVWQFWWMVSNSSKFSPPKIYTFKIYCYHIVCAWVNAWDSSMFCLSNFLVCPICQSFPCQTFALYGISQAAHIMW